MGETLRSGWLTKGRNVKQFERELGRPGRRGQLGGGGAAFGPGGVGSLRGGRSHRAHDDLRGYGGGRAVSQGQAIGSGLTEEGLQCGPRAGRRDSHIEGIL